MKRCWYLVTKKSVWDMASAEIGHVERFFADNRETGKPKRIVKAFRDIQKGDLVFGHVSGQGADSGLGSLHECVWSLRTDADGQRTIGIKKLCDLRETISFAELAQHSVIGQSKPIHGHCLGTLFDLTDAESAEIWKLVESRLSEGVMVQFSSRRALGSNGQSTKDMNDDIDIQMAESSAGRFATMFQERIAGVLKVLEETSDKNLPVVSFSFTVDENRNVKVSQACGELHQSANFCL